MIPLTKILYTYREAAELLSVSEDTVVRLCEERRLVRKYVRPRDPRVTAESIKAYYESLPEERVKI